MINILKKADFFGVLMRNQFQRNMQVIEAGSEAFFHYQQLSQAQVILYGFNQISPKVSTQLYVSDFSLLDLNYDVIKINFWKQQENFIDPFEENVLLPIVVYTQNFSQQQTSQILKNSNQTTRMGNHFYIPKISLGFQKVDGQLMATSEVTIWFVLCQQELLNDGEQCANEEKQKQFFSQPMNTIIIRQTFKQINPQYQFIEEIEQLYYFQIEQLSCYTLSFYLQTTLFELNDHLIFGEPKKKEYITDTQIQAQSNSVQYCTNAFGYEAYGMMYITMKNTQKKTIYQYPNAGDLCANIGSIISILFMIRHIIVYFNQIKLQEMLIKDLISIYYPEFKMVTIKKNWRRQIEFVKLNSLKLNKTEFIEFYDKIRHQILEKLSYFNLLYEISRLQILIRSTKTREEMRKSHTVGAKIQVKEYQQEDLALSKRKLDFSEIQINGQLFNEEDIDLLSLQTRQQILQTSRLINFNCDDNQPNDFYELNRIF